MTAQVEEFIASLVEAPDLRAEFRSSPQETVARAGLRLTDEDLEALQTVDWGDEALLAGASARNRMSGCSTVVSDVNLKENIVAIRWTA